MWFSQQGNNSTNSNMKKSSNQAMAVSSSASSRSHSCSSSTSLLPHITPRRRTMEEVWNDITLPIHHHHHPPFSPDHHHRRRTFRGVILQDFLSGTLSDTPAAAREPNMSVNISALHLPPPPTGLSLSTHFFGSSGMIRPTCSDRSGCHPHSGDSSDNTNGHPFLHPSSNGIFSFCSNQKAFEGPDTSGDCRHKRMIKNRESAARSRARKQAYMNELELDVAHLAEENARLKKQYKELRLAMAAQVRSKSNLQRTSTAPF